MTLHQRIVACLLTLSLAVPSLGCTGMKTIHPATSPTAPTFGRVHAGDTVVVQTRDGKHARFVVQQIDGDAIVSPAGTRYTPGDIERLQRRSFSGWKTGVLIGGSVFAVFVAVAAAAVSALGEIY